MKYGNITYLEYPREIFSGAFNDLSDGAWRTYDFLKEYEHRYCSEYDDWFFRSAKDMARDMGRSESSIRRYIKELETHDPPLLEHHYRKVGRSRVHINVYRLLI